MIMMILIFRLLNHVPEMGTPELMLNVDAMIATANYMGDSS